MNKPIVRQARSTRIAASVHASNRALQQVKTHLLSKAIQKKSKQITQNMRTTPKVPPNYFSTAKGATQTGIEKANARNLRTKEVPEPSFEVVIIRETSLTVADVKGHFSDWFTDAYRSIDCSKIKGLGSVIACTIVLLNTRSNSESHMIDLTQYHAHMTTYITIGCEYEPVEWKPKAVNVWTVTKDKLSSII